MKTSKRSFLRILFTLAICVVTLCCFSVTAFAGADDVAQELPEDAIVERLIEPSAAKDMRDRLRALVEYYSKRDGKDIRNNVMRDTSHFLKCVAPDKPALSE